MRIACLLLFWLLTVTPVAAEEPVTIEFWHAMRGQRGRALELLVEEFNMAHPGVRVVARFKAPSNDSFGNDYASLYRALLESLAKGKPPAVAQVYENWTVQLIEVDALVPVETFIEGDNGLTSEELEDFVPVFLEANRYQDRLWTLPFNKSIYVLFFNRKLLEQAGVRPPETWEALRRSAQEVSAKLKLPGLVFRPGVDTFGHYLYAHGGRFFDRGRVAFAGQVGEEDLQFWADLVHADRSALPAMKSVEVFALGQAAMLIETTSKIGRLEQEPEIDFGVAPLPSGSARAYQFAGTNLAIFSACEPAQRQAAWLFVRYLTDAPTSARWAMETGYLPVRSSAIDSPEYARYVRAHPNYAVGVQALRYAVVQPRLIGWESVRGILDDAMFEVLSRKATPVDALQRAAELSQHLLANLRGRT